MSHFILEPTRTAVGYVLRVGFGDPAQNDVIVREVSSRIRELDLSGSICRIDGPASLPVAYVLCHALAHRFEYIGVFDPKLGKYVVVTSHGPVHRVGDLID